jgi:hypothetical protein
LPEVEAMHPANEVDSITMLMTAEAVKTVAFWENEKGRIPFIVKWA